MAESPAHLRPWTHSVVVSREVHRRQPLIYSWSLFVLALIISFGWCARQHDVAHFGGFVPLRLLHGSLRSSLHHDSQPTFFDLPSSLAVPRRSSTTLRRRPVALHFGQVAAAAEAEPDHDREGSHAAGRPELLRLRTHQGAGASEADFFSTRKLRMLQTVVAKLSAPGSTAADLLDELALMARQDWIQKRVSRADEAEYRDVVMQLFGRIIAVAPKLNNEQTREALVSLAYLTMRDALLAQQLRTRGFFTIAALTQRFTTSGGRDLSGTDAARLVWALGRIGIYIPKAMTVLGDRITDPSQFPALSPKDLAMTAWAVARLQAVGHLPLLHSLGDLLIQRAEGLDDFDAHGVASLAWGFAKLGVRHEALLVRIAARTVTPGFLATWGTRDVSNVVWAFATLDAPNATLTAAVVGHLLGTPGRLEQFEGQSAANLIWALATLGVAQPPLTAAVAERILSPRFLRSLNPQGLANVAWAVVTMDLRQPEVMAAMSRRAAVAEVMKQFDPQDVSILAWAFAKVRSHDPVLFDRLVGRTRSARFFSMFSAQGVSLMAWAWATLRLMDVPLMDAIVERTQDPTFLQTFKSQEVANTVWAFAVLRLRRDPLLTAFAGRLVRSGFLASFTPQGLSNTAWAYASLGYHDEKLFESFSKRVQQPGVLNNFTSPDIAVVTWAFATARYMDERLYSLIADHAAYPEFLATCSGQNMALLAWSFATLGVRNELLMAALAGRMVQSGALLGFSPQALANTAWAFAKLHTRCDALYQALARRLLLPNTLDAFTPQGLGTTAWAFAMFGLHPEVLQAMVPRLLSPGFAETLQPEELYNLAWAFSSLGIRNEELFETLMVQVVTPDVFNGFNPHQTAGVLWAFANLGFHFPDLMRAVAQRVRRDPAFIANFTSAELATTAWAYATLGVRDEALLGILADVAVRPERFERFHLDHLLRLSEAFVALGVRNPLLLEALAKRRAMLGEGPDIQPLG